MTDTPPPAPSPGSHYQPATAVMLLIVALFVAAAFLMLRANPASSPTTTTTLATTTTVHHGKVTHPAKSRVRVQVANGTSTANLARTYTQQLQTRGWDTLGPLNANNKVAATVLYFNPGFLWAAREIATTIKVSFSAIQPLNGLTPVAGAAGDDVIVILGPDVAIRG
ncbi:MAG: LytR C-terminal domain-containing protein [Acidimicrobiales bacterium]